MTTVLADSEVEQEEWISRKQASIVSTLPIEKIDEAAARGLIAVREGVDEIGVQRRYSKASCAELARKLIRPVSRAAVAALSNSA